MGSSRFFPNKQINRAKQQTAFVKCEEFREPSELSPYELFLKYWKMTSMDYTELTLSRQDRSRRALSPSLI